MKNAVECVAIVLIIIVMALACMRAGKKDFALSILPLTLVPVFYTISWLMGTYIFGSVTNLWKLNLVIIMVIIALALSVTLCSLFASNFNKKTKLFFMITASLFNVLLSAILIMNNLQIILDK